MIWKPEPYLGKVVMRPDPEHVGTTEWIGFGSLTAMPLPVLVYFLMLPELCEAYRRPQSGERHARFDPQEFLNLKVEVPEVPRHEEFMAVLSRRRLEILDMRRQELVVRSAIDGLFRA